VPAQALEDWPDPTGGRSKGELKQFVEQRLLSRIARGNRLALRTLYELYFPRLAGFFAHLTLTECTSMTVENLIMATMHAVHRSSAAFNPGEAVHVWIMRTAFDNARVCPVSQSSRHPGTSVIAQLDRLPIEGRAVMHLVYTGFGREETAAVLGVSPGCVDVLLAHARTLSKTPSQNCHARRGSDPVRLSV
jgi:DNA-directed RNA polymerase specialized sigma24 family protein